MQRHDGLRGEGMTLAFVFCVEPGTLESQAILLADSIRQWGGRFADAPIHAFNPRGRGPLANETVEHLSESKVIIHADRLNTEHEEYGYGNKVHACDWAARNLGEDVLVFVDTDTVLVGEPNDLTLDDGIDLAVRPVVSKGEGSTGPDDLNDPYWTRSHELCGVPAGRFVETVRDRQRIRGYYNAGLVAMRRDSGISERWLDFLRRFFATDHRLGAKFNNLDQHALAMVAAGSDDRTLVLDARHNYPIPQRARLPEPDRSRPMSELVQLHYHRWFHARDFLTAVSPKFDLDDPRVEWLRSRLPLEPSFDEAPFGSDLDAPETARTRRATRAKWREGFA